MAQTALSGANLSLIRGEQWLDGLSLHVTPLVVVASGTITALPNKYPTVRLTVSWDGSTSGVRIGQYYRIFDGDTIVSHGIIRKDVNFSVCYINETPLGSFGFATNIETAIAVGNTIEIYSHHAMFSLNSRIASKEFFKYWDLAYTNQNEKEWPVANAGTWQSAILENGATTARFTLPRNGTNISFALATPDGVVEGNLEWTLPAGVTIVSGYAVDDAVIEVDAVAGRHLIKLTVFNSGEEHSAYLWLFVADGTSGIDLNETYAIAIDSYTRGQVGTEVSFTVWGDDLEDVFYNGAGVLFKERAKYAGEELSAGVGVDTFVGYITELTVEHDGNIGKATFKAISPMLLAQQIGQPSQSLTQVTEATNWNQTEASYANCRAYIHYLIKWTCPALMDMHDLDIPYAYEEPPRKYLEVNNKNLGANLQVVADYLLGSIGSSADGTTVVRKKPQYMSNTDRNLNPSIWTILEQDIKAPLTYGKRMYNAFSDVRGGAFAGLGKPKAFYGGRRWSQGAGQTEMTNFITPTTNAETIVKQTVGHFMAEQNAALQTITVDLIRNQDVVDPAYLCWYGLTVGTAFDPYGTGFAGTRLIATEIAIEYEVDGGGLKKRISLTGQIETFGQEGEILPIGSAKGISQGGWTVGSPQPWTPNISTGMFSGGQAVAIAIALNQSGEIGISGNYLSDEPSWQGLNLGVGNIPISDFDFDYGSAFFANGRSAADALGLYAVTVDGNDAQIWYYPDILRSNSANELVSYNLSDETITTNARIKCSETYPDLVIAVFKDATGTRFARTVNGGDTWSTLTRVGSAITDIQDNDNAPIGLAVFGQYQFVTAPNSSNEYGTYRATTAAGSFTKMTGSQDSAAPIPMIAEAIETEDKIYVSQWDVVAYRNEFDGFDAFVYDGCYTGGYAVPTWARSKDSICFSTVYTPDWVYGGIVSGGVTGDCLYYYVTSPGSSTTIDTFAFIFDWASTALDCYDFSFDVKFTAQNPAKTLRIGGTAVDSAPIVLEGQNEWHHVRAKDFGIATNFPITVGQIQPEFHINGGDIGLCEVFIDNVTFYLGAGYRLWQVDNATGSPSWTDVSPVVGGSPDEPFGLIVDVLDNQNLQLVSAIAHDWYRTTNSGSTWTLRGAGSDFRTFYTVGENMLLGGDDTIQISFNRGTSDTSIEGDLDNLWNGLGTIKKLLAL